MQFSATHYQLPPEVDGLLSALNQARLVAIKMSPKQPKIEHVERLEKLLTGAFSLARKFHGIQVCNDVYSRVSRVKRHLAPGARKAGALVRAIEEALSVSEDESDESESQNIPADNEPDSEESSSDDEGNSDEESDTELDTEDPSFAKNCEIECISDTSELGKHAGSPVTCSGSKVTVELPFLFQAVKNIVQPQHPNSSCAGNLEKCTVADMKGELGNLFLKMSQEEEDKLYEGLLKSAKSSTTCRKTHSNGFKKKKSQIHSQIKSTFKKCSKTLTTSNLASMMGDLVNIKTVNSLPKATINTGYSQSHVTQPSNGNMTSQKSVAKVKPVEELAEDMTTSFSSVSYEHAKSMNHISEQMSRSSMSTSASSSESAMTKNGVALKDGPVKFILRSSPLTAVLEQKKKNGQTLMFPSFIESCISTGQKETKTRNPIKESRLTAIVKNVDTVQYYAKVFAEKMQQTLSNQLNDNIPSVEQKEADKNKRRFNPIKESRLTAVVQEKGVVQHYAKLFAEKMKETFSKSVNPIPTAGRVILSAKRTKKSVSVNPKLSSVNIGYQANTMTDDLLSSGHKLSLGFSQTTSFEAGPSVESVTRKILGKV